MSRLGPRTEPLPLESPEGGHVPHLDFMRRFLVVAGGDLLAKAIGFGGTLITIRYFGATGLGQVSFAAAIAVWGMLSASLGLDLLAVQRVAAEPARVAAIATTIAVIRTIAGLLVLAALVPLLIAVPTLSAIWLIVLLSCGTILTQAISLDWAAQALQRPVVLALSNVWVQACALAVIWLCARLSVDVWIVPTAGMLAEVTGAAALWVWLRRSAGGWQSPIPLGEWRPFVRAALPLGGSRMLRGLSLGSDLVLPAMMLPMREFGRYAGMTRLYGPGLSIAALYLVILIPPLVRAVRAGPEVVRRELRASFLRCACAGTPLLVLALWLAEPIVGGIFGPSFVSGVASLRILMLSLAATLISNHFRQTLIAQDRRKTDFSIQFMGLIVHVMGKIALIPLFGIAGAAAGNLAGESTSMLLGWWATQSVWRKTPSGHT